MANYFVINNKFKPYSFDELIKPYQMYGQAYREQEAILDAAREKEFSPDYLDQQQDAVAYNMYNQANTQLQAASDELATKGLSAGLRGRLRTTARDYKRTMDTLNEAQARLYAERDRRAKLGPDYVYQQDDIRIGDFLNGASPNQRGESLSGISRDIATEFATRAKTITDSTWSKVLDKNGKRVGYYDITTRSGLSAAQLDTILADDSTWQSIMDDKEISTEEKRNLQRFRDAIQSKKDAVGFDAFNDINKDRIQNAINIGAIAGLETISHDYKKDESYDPLGWSRLAFEKEKYGDAVRAKNLELQIKYPQYQFDDKGEVKRDENGSIIINPGWTEKNGKWYGPNGEVNDGSGNKSSKSTYIGVVHYNKSGEKKTYGSDKEWNNTKVGEGVTNASQLSKKNIQRLAIALNITGAATDAEVFEEAVRRGVDVSVINHGFDKDEYGNKNKIKDNQELILRGTKTIGTPSSTFESEGESFDIDG